MTQANVLPSDRVALEPCPFCGASAEHDSRHYSGMKHPNGLMICGHAVYCSNAGCIGQPAFSLVWPDDEGGLPEAIAAWNTRHRDASARELVEALECAERDLTATYEVAKAGKVAIISIGQFQRLDRIRAALASAGAQP